MKKGIIIFVFIFSLFSFSAVSAQEQDEPTKSSNQETFKAEIIEQIKTKNIKNQTDEEEEKQQSFRLEGLSGSLKYKEFVITTEEAPDALVKNEFKVGDRVLVMKTVDENGATVYAITDYIRTNIILWLFVAFIFSVIIIGRIKGIRSLLSLLITFFIIIKYAVPQILDGADPVTVTVISSIGILISIIYLTEGFNIKSHISTFSILISLLFTVFLSWFLVDVANLSGLTNEEAGFIVNLGVVALNLKGILLAGIIIGALGVLDDVVIAQVATVYELCEANPYFTSMEVYKKSLNIGISHISAMTNTLFLAYAGASLPLLILFVSGQSSFSGWDVAINNEMLATEIIRTLVGTMGLILSVPIATFISVLCFKKNKFKK